MCDGLRTLVSYNKPASAERFSFQPVTTLACFVSAAYSLFSNANSVTFDSTRSESNSGKLESNSTELESNVICQKTTFDYFFLFLVIQFSI